MLPVPIVKKFVSKSVRFSSNSAIATVSTVPSNEFRDVIAFTLQRRNRNVIMADKLLPGAKNADAVPDKPKLHRIRNLESL